MISKLRKLVGLPWRDRLLLIEAAVTLAGSRLAVLLLPFRWIAPRLGETMADSVEEDPAEPELLRRIGWSVSVASHHLPWTSRCLAEAIAGKLMLQRRGVPSTLYLGLAKEGQGKEAAASEGTASEGTASEGTTAIEAHAWLRCGSRILTGGGTSDSYEVIASFAEPSADG